MKFLFMSKKNVQGNHSINIGSFVNELNLQDASIFAMRIRARNPPSAIGIVGMPRGSLFLNRYPAVQIRSACRFLDYKMHNAPRAPGK